MDNDSDDGHRNENADDFLRHLDSQEEDQNERKGRHYVEGQLSWNGVRELQDLGRTVAKLAASVDKVTTLAASTATLAARTEKSVAQIQGWLLDTHDSSGHPIPGVLTQMQNVGTALLAFTKASEKRDTDKAEADDKRSKTFETYARLVVGGIVTLTFTVLAQALHLVH